MPCIKETTKALHVFGALDENLRVATAMVFLIIAQNPAGVTARTIGERTGLTQPAVNRAVLRLGSRKSESHSVGQALGWIHTLVDPEETRRHLFTLSPEGKKVLKMAGMSAGDE